MTIVWVLYLTVASGAIFGGDWTTPVEVGEFDTVEQCRASAETATYIYKRRKWEPFIDGAICISRQKKEEKR
jgi:hypothetical protein